MKLAPKYLVTFKNSYDPLVSMFQRQYSSLKAAKTAIELDAEHFVWAHRHADSPHRQKSNWVHPKTEDYYEAHAHDGTSCIWQYFKVA